MTNITSMVGISWGFCLNLPNLENISSLLRLKYPQSVASLQENFGGPLINDWKLYRENKYKASSLPLTMITDIRVYSYTQVCFYIIQLFKSNPTRSQANVKLWEKYSQVCSVLSSRPRRPQEAPLLSPRKGEKLTKEGRDVFWSPWFLAL